VFEGKENGDVQDEWIFSMKNHQSYHPAFIPGFSRISQPPGNPDIIELRRIQR
jgi:hypothetical protein